MGGGPQPLRMVIGPIEGDWCKQSEPQQDGRVEAAVSFLTGAARAARTGRAQLKGAATEAAQFACALELLLHHKVEVIAPALQKRRLCQEGCFTRWHCQQLRGGFAK